MSFDESGSANHGNILGAIWSNETPAPPVYGCTDSYADNYNSDANLEMGVALVTQTMVNILSVLMGRMIL